MWIGLHLVRSGLVTAEQLLTAIEYCESHRPPIGQIAIQKRKLTVAECFKVLSRQAIQPDNFGCIARELRLLSKRQVADLLLAQSEQTPTLSSALVATSALTQKEIERELAQARFERRLRDDIDAFEEKPLSELAPEAGEPPGNRSSAANDTNTA